MMKRLRLTVIGNGCACAFGTVDQTLNVMVSHLSPNEGQLLELDRKFPRGMAVRDRLEAQD